MADRKRRLDVRVLVENNDCPTCGSMCPTCTGGVFAFDSIRVYADGSYRIYHECTSCGESTMARTPLPEVVKAHEVGVQ